LYAKLKSFELVGIAAAGNRVSNFYSPLDSIGYLVVNDTKIETLLKTKAMVSFSTKRVYTPNDVKY